MINDNEIGERNFPHAIKSVSCGNLTLTREREGGGREGPPQLKYLPFHRFNCRVGGYFDPRVGERDGDAGGGGCKFCMKKGRGRFRSREGCRAVRDENGRIPFPRESRSTSF